MKIAIIGLGWIGYALALRLSREYDIVGSKRSLSSLHDTLLGDSYSSNKLKTFALTLPLDHDEQFKGIEPTQYASQSVIIGLLDKTDCLVITLPASREPSILSRYSQSVQQLVELAEIFSIDHIIFTSSTSVYGDEPGCYKETSQCKPASKPGIVLKELEQWLINKLGSKITILRLAGLAGAYRHPGRFFQNKESSLLLEGSSLINFVHRIDVIRAIEALIKHRAENTQSYNSRLKLIYNLCAPIHPSRNRFYQYTSSLLGLPAPIFKQSNEQKNDFPFKNSQRVIDGFAITRDINFNYLYPNPFNFTYNDSIK